MSADGWIAFGGLCEVCGAPVRDGLRFCSGMSDCLKKGIGIMDVTTKLSDGWQDRLIRNGFKPTDDPQVFVDSHGTHVRFGEPQANGRLVVGDVVTPKHDPVNHPSHYTMGEIEVIDALAAWGFAEDFCKGNAIKYLARAGRKATADELEDLKKAAWYANKLVELKQAKK